MKLSKYFSYNELVKNQDISNTQAFINIVHLCMAGLDPIREKFQKPMIITSGYRSPEYNSKIGGAKKSQHTKGEAADFIIRGVELLDVFGWIKNYHEYDQVIHEMQGEKEWIHYSYNFNLNRRVAMIARHDGNKMNYTIV